MRKVKKKKISRKQLLYILFFSVFCVLGLTVAYAALSTSLNISGSANVNQSSWGITIEEYPLSDYFIDINGVDHCNSQSYFTCDNNAFIWANAKVEQFPTIAGTSLRNFSLSVSIPDDTVTLLYKVTNSGTIPAKLDSINKYTPTYSSSKNNSADVLWAQNNVVFIFDLAQDGTEVKSLVEGDIVCPGDTRTLALTLDIPTDVTTIPTGSVTISNAGVDYNFVQADMSVCS